MTFPIDLVIGSVVIPSHTIFDVLSMFVAYRYYVYLKKQRGDSLSEESRWGIIVGAAAGALLGSRLLAALERPSLFFNPPHVLYYFMAGKTIAGGIVGGILGVEITKKLMGEKQSSGDLFTYPLILGIIVGRIGCFLTGIKDATVGNPSTLPWAMDQGDGILRHPTALYEITYLIFVWLFLKWIANKYELPQGIIFKIFVTLYLLFRLFVEFIKPVHPLVIGLTSIQLVSLIVVLIYLTQLWNHRILKKK